MKQLIQLILTFITIFMTACSTSQPIQSSHNSDKDEGFLQKHLNDWLKNDWEPTVKDVDKNSSKRFKLQDYVDKAAVYMKAHPSDENNSNVKKMETLPVIGKQP